MVLATEPTGAHNKHSLNCPSPLLLDSPLKLINDILRGEAYSTAFPHGRFLLLMKDDLA